VNISITEHRSALCLTFECRTGTLPSVVKAQLLACFLSHNLKDVDGPRILTRMTSPEYDTKSPTSNFVFFRRNVAVREWPFPYEDYIYATELALENHCEIVRCNFIIHLPEPGEPFKDYVNPHK